MNGKKYKLTEVREHLEFMSELGYKFKRLPSHDNTIKFQASISDDIINTYMYEIRGTSLKRLFSLCKSFITV